MMKPWFDAEAVAVGGSEAAVHAGTVTEVLGPGEVTVRVDEEGAETWRCVLLYTGGSPLVLRPGHSVLVWSGGGDHPLRVVLGQVGLPEANDGLPEANDGLPEANDDGDMPDEVVIEAKEQLTLRCGDGAICLRGDGKVLIRGKELVSRATGSNKIKGGSVAIN